MRSTTSGWTTSRFARAALTIGVVGLYLWLARTQHFPWIDVERLHRRDRADPHELVGIFDIGYTPVMFAFIVVEFAALLRPSWNRLRVGGPDERTRLMPATLAVALVLTTYRAWSLARSLPYVPFGAFGPEVLEIATIVSLVAGSFLFLAAADLITRHGIGNGFMVLISSAFASAIARTLDWEFQSAPVAPGRVVIGPAVIVALTIAIHDRRVRSLVSSSALRLPTAGYWPIELVVSASLAIVLFIMRSGVLTTVAQRLHTDGWQWIAFKVLLVLVSAWVLTRLFARADRPRHSPPPSSSDLSRAALASAVAALVVRFLPLAVGNATGIPLRVEAVGWLYVTSALLDLREEWNARTTLPALVEAWPIHRLGTLDAALETLSAAGIPACARGSRYRALLQILGPHVPVAILVPVEDLTRARQLLIGHFAVEAVAAAVPGAPAPSA